MILQESQLTGSVKGHFGWERSSIVCLFSNTKPKLIILKDVEEKHTGTPLGRILP